MIYPVLKKIRNQVEGETVSVGIIGDVSFHNLPTPSLAFFNPLTEIIQGTDIVIANIETVVTERPLVAAKNKGIFLKSQPEFLKILRQLGVNVALIANNHIDDYGVSGIEDTVKHLLEQDILPFGVKGRDFIYIEKKEIRFALKGVITPYENTDLLVSYGERLDSVTPIKIDTNAHLLYFIHGFDELYSIPFPWRVKLLKKIRDVISPAALIAGHQHIFQGYSVLGNTPVCWSYGNGFMKINYHEAINEDANICCYSVLHFDKKGCYQIDEYYYSFSFQGVKVLGGADLEQVLERVQKGIECTENHEKNEEFWTNECYLNYNSHRFNKNVVLNFLYDIYRWFRWNKHFRYIHYRLMFLGYLKKKWGIGFGKF